MKLFEKINNWLNKNYCFWEEDTREGFVRFITGIFTLVLFLVLGFTKVLDIELIILIWAGIITFIPPVLAALIAIFKKDKWNPWFWFPMIKGGVLWGILAITIMFVCRRWLGF